ncbi:hypothetical protein [Burkholderia sp. Z1]|uniref:hypothetical protein n=1 Tax=Burkholderia sp. Z1 TaxID=2759039 RepID=UPI001868A329|nr:hypothetical protein [Burkholderia sp. Z1]
MSDTFRIVPPMVRAEGKDVPPEQIQAALNALANQCTAAFNILGNGSGAAFAAIMLAWFNSLPTSPGAVGTLWNDGGTLAQVQP